MITCGKYTLRKGKKNDLPGSGWSLEKNESVPDYVLLHEGEQIGASYGSQNQVFWIEIFEKNRRQGHGTKFVELREKETKCLGHEGLMFHGVGPNRFLKTILKNRGYVEKDGGTLGLKLQ